MGSGGRNDIVERLEHLLGGFATGQLLPGPSAAARVPRINACVTQHLLVVLTGSGLQH